LWISGKGREGEKQEKLEGKGTKFRLLPERSRKKGSAMVPGRLEGGSKLSTTSRRKERIKKREGGKKAERKVSGGRGVGIAT